MTTLTAPSPPPLSRNREVVLDIDLGDDDATLVRVLTVLRRRGCVLRRVDFEADDWHRPGHLAVTVDAPASHAHCVAAWVENLVDVRGVSDRAN